MPVSVPIMLDGITVSTQARDDALLREVNHRASNSLQIVASILSLHARESESSQVHDELCAAASRVRAISLVHERLYKTDLTESMDVGGYLHELVSDIERSYGDPGNTAFKFEATSLAPTHLHPSSVVKLGIIVTELLTNSVKYAGRPATCRVALSATPQELEVIVSDNGTGLKVDAKVDSGVGMKIVKHQLDRLQGTLVASFGSRGAHFVIKVPFGRGADQY
jgi:two-component sensor histidine kinase